MKTEIATSLILTAILMVVSALGLTEARGAHPFWAMQTGVIGSGAGLMCYAGSRWAGMRPERIVIPGGLMLVLAGVAAVQGKSLFVASFAESALAGRFWYFGWFAVMAALCMTLCALAARALRR